MSTSYTPNKNLPYPGINDTGWGQTLNTSIVDIDTAFGGTGQVTLSGSSGNSVNLDNSGAAPSSPGLAGARIRISGSVSQSTSLVIQNGIKGVWVVTVDAGVVSGSYTLTLKGSASDTGVLLPVSGSTIVYSDGTYATSAISGSSGSYLPTSGNNTYTGNLGVTGTLTVSAGSGVTPGPSAITTTLNGYTNVPAGSTLNIAGTLSIPGTFSQTTLSLAGTSAATQTFAVAQGISNFSGNVNVNTGFGLALGGATAAANAITINGTQTINGAAATALTLSSNSSVNALSVTSGNVSIGSGAVITSLGGTSNTANFTTSGSITAGSGGFISTSGGVIAASGVIKGSFNIWASSPAMNMNNASGTTFGQFYTVIGTGSGFSYSGGTNAYVGTTSAAGMFCSGPYTNTSDARLKTNVQTIDGATSIIKSLRGVYFNFIDDPEKKQVGLIAQEVNACLPEVVSENNEGYLGIQYSSIVGVLINAVKELEARVAELEAKVS